MRRLVRFPKMPLGMLPVRATPGRRSTVTRLSSQLTPAHEHGLLWFTFQSRVRPPTAERRARRAARSEARSGFAMGSKTSNEEMKRKRESLRLREWECILVKTHKRFWWNWSWVLFVLFSFKAHPLFDLGK